MTGDDARTGSDELRFPVGVRGWRIRDDGAEGFSGLLRVAREIFYGHPDNVMGKGVLNVKVAVQELPDGRVVPLALNIENVEFGSVLELAEMDES